MTSAAHRPKYVLFSQEKKLMFYRFIHFIAIIFMGVAHICRLFWRDHGGYESRWCRVAPEFNHPELDSHSLYHCSLPLLKHPHRKSFLVVSAFFIFAFEGPSTWQLFQYSRTAVACSLNLFFSTFTRVPSTHSLYSTLSSPLSPASLFCSEQPLICNYLDT